VRDEKENKDGGCYVFHEHMLIIWCCRW